MMKNITDFVKQFGIEINWKKKRLLRQNEKMFLIKDDLRPYVAKNFFHAGIYLGKTRDNRFLPSFYLLRLIATKNASKIMVNKKTEWLFTCGRDVFRQGVVEVSRSKRKSEYSLIMNEENECLGFGKMLSNFDQQDKRLVVRNILDIGDFLRRER